MRKLHAIDQSVLHRNAHPGVLAESAFLPNVVPLSGAEVLCFYRVGSAFYSPDGRIAQLRSADGGRTWRRDGHVWDPANDALQWNYTAPHGTRLRDGAIVVVASRRGYRDPDLPADGPAPPQELVLFRSGDDGRSWSDPQPLGLPRHDGVRDAPSQIVEMDGGRWFLGIELWNAGGPFSVKGHALFSDDAGKTWGDRVDYPSASDAERVYSHSRYTRMLDGGIAVLQWTQEPGSGKDFDLHLTTSDPTGSVWSSPRPTGIPGQTSWLADLGDGLLAAAYTSRDGMSPGIKAVLSEDGGKSWDLAGEVLVWDAVGQEYLGVGRRPDYPASHDNLAFGKPNMARLPGGELICSWWCTQACVTHTRFARLAVE